MPKKIFDRVKNKEVRKSAFNLSRNQKTSFNFGELIPTLVQEIVPGDQFRVKTETMLRLAPMLAPVMHNIDVYCHYFFVPNRIVWNQWEEFITGGQDGQTSAQIPTREFGAKAIEQYPLADYLGVPSIVNRDPAETIAINTIPFRAYQLIWNEYYRDENLNEDLTKDEALKRGNLTTNQELDLRMRCWEKDYFTSSLPFAQRGPDASVPFDPQYKESSLAFNAANNSKVLSENIVTDGEGKVSAKGTTDPDKPIRIENLSDQQTGFNINELRRSTALQRWLEKSARGGYRYIETILSHFGVRSSDARLNRPEYLGGGKQPIGISEVVNTTGTSENPQGALAGHGISAGQTNTFQGQFEEHGYVIGIMSILPQSTYQQGLPRHFNRKDRFDYYWPTFAHLGEQEVKNVEIFAQEDQSENNQTFGYQQRYAEYKYGKSTVHGDFRNSLDFWHVGRKFENQPNLNKQFVNYPKRDGNNNPPDKRIFATQGQGDHIWAMLHHDVKARRPMPYFADPRLS